jgi:chromosomal replication initiator protein
MDPVSCWTQLLTSMNRYIGHQNVEIWLKSARAVSLVGGELTIEVGNSYYRDWIAENYQNDLEKEASALLGKAISLNYVFQSQPAGQSNNPPATSSQSATESMSIGINTHQTFDNFVVGECNKFAHAAASAVADFPAQQYNPLFIYGATGLGKTHLMHAVGNEILSRHPDARAMYVTAEDFMNEMINSIRHQRTEEFRNKYRKHATVLLVDDIQFLSKKDRTQEEFFHTFNALQSSGRQIILTSDVTPGEIEKLEPRLRTRFEGGLIADMQAPDNETLLAILWQRADLLRLTFPNDLATAIANRVSGNIRELEGILNRLAALYNFYNEPLTLEFCRNRLPNIFTTNSPTLSVVAIIEAVAQFHNIRSADITGKRRTRTLTAPRHVAMFLSRKHTSLSYPELGREFGGRDHSTIQHGCRKVEGELRNNADLTYKLRLIEQTLNVRSF